VLLLLLGNGSYGTSVMRYVFGPAPRAGRWDLTINDGAQMIAAGVFFLAAVALEFDRSCHVKY